jgi:competence protein ComEA
MTTPPGSWPPGDGAWASRLTARPAAQPAARRASRRTSARRASLAGDRFRLVHEHLAARFAIPPRAVLGLVLVSVAVLTVLTFRLVLAGREVAASPVAPAVAGSPADARSGTAAIPGAGGPGAAGVSTPSAPAPGPLAEHSGAAGGVAAPEQRARVASASVATTVGPGGVLGAGPGSGEVVVHVVGRVRHPGVVRLPVGARVQQAVTAAGGARRDADLARVNLARPLVDGEQVVVPRPGEPVGGVAAAGAVPVAPGGAPPGASPAGGGPAPGQLVNLNTATLAELDTLPGVGPVLAQRILDWRAQNGRFTAVEELGEVSGIGDAVLARVRPLVGL